MNIAGSINVIIFPSNLIMLFQVKIEVPRLVSAISNLGYVLRMLNHRKQMLVSVQNAYINSTEDAKLIQELVESGFHLDQVDIDFRESKSRSTEEQNIQVNTVLIFLGTDFRGFYKMY